MSPRTRRNVSDLRDMRSLVAREEGAAIGNDARLAMSDSISVKVVDAHQVLRDLRDPFDEHSHAIRGDAQARRRRRQADSAERSTLSGGEIQESYFKRVGRL